MKNSIKLMAAIAAIVSGSAFAANSTDVDSFAVASVGSASYLTVNGNGAAFSAQEAGSFATNSSSVGAVGSNGSGSIPATAGTSAATSGYTLTGVRSVSGSIGGGDVVAAGAVAGAYQDGHAIATSQWVYNQITGQWCWVQVTPVGPAQASSEAGVWGGSTAKVGENGYALSGTANSAANISGALFKNTGSNSIATAFSIGGTTNLLGGIEGGSGEADAASWVGQTGYAVAGN